jgi:hypothetical protein
MDMLVKIEHKARPETKQTNFCQKMFWPLHALSVVTWKKRYPSALFDGNMGAWLHGDVLDCSQFYPKGVRVCGVLCGGFNHFKRRALVV